MDRCIKLCLLLMLNTLVMGGDSKPLLAMHKDGEPVVTTYFDYTGRSIVASSKSKQYVAVNLTIANNGAADAVSYYEMRRFFCLPFCCFTEREEVSANVNLSVTGVSQSIHKFIERLPAEDQSVNYSFLVEKKSKNRLRNIRLELQLPEWQKFDRPDDSAVILQRVYEISIESLIKNGILLDMDKPVNLTLTLSGDYNPQVEPSNLFKVTCKTVGSVDCQPSEYSDDYSFPAGGSSWMYPCNYKIKKIN